MERVKINVSGTLFEFRRDVLKDKQSDRLARLCCPASAGSNDKQSAITVDRSAICFGAILSYYQTGELHIPPGVCFGAFRQEMEFWEIDSNALHECCIYRYQTFLDDEDTRRQFLQNALLPSIPIVFPETTTTHQESKIKRCRARLWKVMDNEERSIAAKAYFILVFVMVLLSIFVLAFSTVPSMRRPVSKCELLEYMKSINHKHVEQIHARLGNPDCSNSGSWLTSGDWEYEEFSLEDYDFYFYEYSWGEVWDYIQGMATDPVTNLNDSVRSIIPETTPSATTHASTTMGETNRNSNNGFRQLANDLLGKSEAPLKKMLDIPILTVPKLPFDILEIIINIFFTVDLVLRLASCPSFRRYFLSIINIFDALALLSSYIYIIIVSIEKQYRYKESDWLNLLDFAQVFRALRLFRVVKNVRASKVLAYSLTQNVRDMTLLVTLLFVGISTFACLFYFAESRETIDSIPNAWYWAVVTMTTVGYGDISPKTGFGRVISSLCATCGVLLLAVTLPMFVNNFLTLYQYSCVTESLEKGKKQTYPKPVRNDLDLVVDEVVDEPPAYETPETTKYKYPGIVSQKTKAVT